MSGKKLRVIVVAAEFAVFSSRFAASTRGAPGQGAAFYVGGDADAVLMPVTISGMHGATELGYSGC